MKIELRKVHYSKALSQETAAFTADIYVDGKKRGDVRNDGGGGANLVHPHTLAAEIEAYAKTLPPVPASEAFGMELSMCADLVLGDLLDSYLAAKDLARAMKGKVLFTKADGKLYAIKATGSPVTAVVPNDAAHVLNTMPPADALALYLKASAR